MIVRNQVGPIRSIGRYITFSCKKYDETVTVINTSKGNDVYREQQSVKHYKGTKRILVVDDEYDTNLTLKVVLEESDFKVGYLEPPTNRN